MQEVDKAEAKSLLTLRIVPVAQLVQIDAPIHCVEYSGQQSTHESDIVLIHGFKSRDELSFICVDICCVLFIHQLGSFFLDSELNDSLKLLPPDLLSLDIQEVLNVLN